MHVRWSVISPCIFTIILAAMMVSAGCSSASPPTPLQPSSGSSLQEPATRQSAQAAGAQGALSLRVASLSPGSTLPDVYTCKGTMESPEVAWSDIPAGTKSLVLILDDPDAHLPIVHKSKTAHHFFFFETHMFVMKYSTDAVG